MPSKSRCVFGCVTRGVTIHNFPNPSKYPERFRQWVNLVGLPLAGMTDIEIYEKKKVCDVHFMLEHRNRNKRLSALAVPSLHLPQIPNVGYEQMETDQQDILPSTSMSTRPSGIPSVDYEHMETDQQVIMQSTSMSTRPSEIPNVGYEQMETDQRDILPSTSMSTRPSGPKRCVQKCLVHNQTQRDIRRLKQEIIRLRKRCNNFKTRLDNAEKLSNAQVLQKVTSKMTLPAKLFTNMQFRESQKKPKGRRFNMSEKVLCLSLFKRSPKSYPLLSKCFTLPAAKTLRNLLGKLKISPGINKPIIKNMKIKVSNMSQDERLCTLIFDEMHINPQIHYDAQNDILKGFDSFGNKKIADHVLTFMVRGVKKQYKQPVAYYFSQNMTKYELKSVIKTVIKAVNSTGLQVIATVCDQSSVNVGAIESLIEDSKAIYLRDGKPWRTNLFLIDEQSVIPLYDVPHLIKGIRNNLLSKNLRYIDPNDKNEKIIKWEYFVKLYESDKSYGELKILQKFTEEHVMPEKMNKMKVKLATQLFSHSVAIAVKHLCDAGKLHQECQALVPFVLFMDKLFDSLNANTFNALNGKVYRAGVKQNSPHHALWRDSIVFLKNLNFYDKQGKNRKVPSVDNFVKTIEGMQALWKILNQKHGFDTMLTRNFNQDPIENFFGNIRSLGVRNVSPTSINFEGAYKSLLLSNFCSAQSIKTNCEDDMASYLHTLDFLLNESTESNIKTTAADLPQEIIINESLLNNICDSQEGLQQSNYVCGWVLRKCLKNICKGCKTCRSQLIDSENVQNIYIMQKEYENKQWLVYPSQGINNYFRELQNITATVLRENVDVYENIRQNIKSINELLNNASVFACKNHKEKLRKHFDESTINLLIHSWCRTINRILCGKITYDGNDDSVKRSAQMFYNKNKNYKVKK